MCEDRIEKITLSIFITIALLSIFILIIVVRNRNVKYKYFIGEETGISEKCYVDSEKGCMCLINDKFEQVDSYYEE